ncbi:MAG: hypothetical protein KIH08_02220 [Candidatus Freyarchaeota archaeon]|nr:hypothetical protein [Candidatus Jordarchaeia archaeon]MBS7268457.1 hypothetical protein [Candidatus Jordarchaeia archaeon]MBS7280394.1 hypothetical protein [Candidatus Jordarchaeia archaeon]
MMAYRPEGVVSLAIAYIVMQVLGIMIAFLIVRVVLPPQYFLVSLQFGNEYLMRLIFSNNGNIIGTSVAMQLSEELFLIESFNFSAWGVLIFSVVSLPASICLLSMKKWGRYLSLVIGILLIVIALPLVIHGIILESFTFMFGLIPLLFGIGTIVYLTGDAKYDFT